MASDKLKEAIKLIKAGEKQQGGRLLAEILKADPNNETAWLWRSLTVTTPQQQREYLKKVLQLNPDHEQARQALTELERQQKKQPSKQNKGSAVTLSRPLQIGIVAVLGLTACCIFGVTGILLWSPAPETAVVNQPAAPTLPTNTPEPTATPVPTDTPQPTATPIPGWKRMTGGPVELWLPESYEGGDSKENIVPLLNTLRGLGAGYEPLARTIQENPSLLPFLALDAANPGIMVMVTRDEIPSDWTLEMVADTLLEAVSKQPAYQVQITERKHVSLDHYEAEQSLLQVQGAETSSFELLYIIKAGNTAWTVFYMTAPEQFGQQLPVFEQSIQTFRVKL